MSKAKSVQYFPYCMQVYCICPPKCAIFAPSVLYLHALRSCLCKHGPYTQITNLSQLNFLHGFTIGGSKARCFTVLLDRSIRLIVVVSSLMNEQLRAEMVDIKLDHANGHTLR